MFDLPIRRSHFRLHFRLHVMPRLTLQEWTFIGLCFGGFFYGEIICYLCITASAKAIQLLPGLYSGIFVMYLRYSVASKENTVHRPTHIFYALCTLYICSLAIFILDIVNEVGNNSVRNNNDLFLCYQFCSSSKLETPCT